MDASTHREQGRNWLTLGGFAVVVAFGLVVHEPWRDELQAWTIARASATPTALLRNIRHEGHPILWYAILWPFAKLQSSIWMLQLLQWCIAVATAAVVLWKSPFSRVQRSLLLFGYFSLFEYGVLARSYGLGLLLAVTAMACIAPTRRWLAFGITLGLLALTSAFATILAIAILIGVLIHNRDMVTTTHRREATTAAAVALAGCVVAYAQAQPSGNTNAFQNWNFRFDADLGSATIAAIFKSFIPLQKFTQSWWNTSIADGHTGAASLAGVGIVSAIIFIWRAQIGAMMLWLVAAGGSVAFMYLKLGQADAARYYGAIWIAFVAAAWLVTAASPAANHAEHTSEMVAIQTNGDAVRNTSRVLTIVLVAQLFIGLGAYVRDVRRPFTDAAATADWLNDRDGNDSVIVACPDFIGSALAGYLERSIIYPQGGREGTFTIWDVRRQREILNLADALAITKASATVPRYLVTNTPVPALRLETSFTRGIVADEHYWVYRITEQALRERLDPCQTQ